MRRLELSAPRPVMGDGAGMTGVRHTDPCSYCGRPLAQVATDGCGSQERGFSQERVNALCEVYERARRER